MYLTLAIGSWHKLEIDYAVVILGPRTTFFWGRGVVASRVEN